MLRMSTFGGNVVAIISFRLILTLRIDVYALADLTAMCILPLFSL